MTWLPSPSSARPTQSDPAQRPPMGVGGRTLGQKPGRITMKHYNIYASKDSCYVGTIIADPEKVEALSRANAEGHFSASDLAETSHIGHRTVYAIETERRVTIGTNGRGHIVARHGLRVIDSRSAYCNPAALRQLVSSVEGMGFTIDWEESRVAKPEWA